MKLESREPAPKPQMKLESREPAPKPQTKLVSKELPINPYTGHEMPYKNPRDIRIKLQRGVRINEETLTGIPNFGNTCFANVLLQIFVIILRNSPLNYCTERQTCYLCAMLNLYNDYINNNIQTDPLKHKLIMPIYDLGTCTYDRTFNKALDLRDTEEKIIRKLNESQHGREFVARNFECKFNGDTDSSIIEILSHDLNPNIQLEINNTLNEIYGYKILMTYPLYFTVIIAKTSKIQILDEVYLQNKDQKYNLFAAIVHIGSDAGGHYTTFIKYRNNWFYIDDANEVIITDFNSAVSLYRNNVNGICRLIYKKI